VWAIFFLYYTVYMLKCTQMQSHIETHSPVDLARMPLLSGWAHSFWWDDLRQARHAHTAHTHLFTHTHPCAHGHTPNSQASPRRPTNQSIRLAKCVQLSKNHSTVIGHQTKRILVAAITKGFRWVTHEWSSALFLSSYHFQSLSSLIVHSLTESQFTV